MRLAAGLRPDPLGGGSLSAPLDPSAAIGEGPTSKGNGGKWRGMGRKGE